MVMLNRRDLMKAAVAAGALPSFGAAAGTEPASDETARFHALLDRFAQQQLELHPEQATGLGLDNGSLASLKSRLSNASLDGRVAARAQTAQQLKDLGAIDRGALKGIDVSSFETVLFTLRMRNDGDRSFDYGGESSGEPYVLSQLSGAYQQVPDFMGTQHTIETADDADAYLARLSAFAHVMDQELDATRHDVGLGVVPPDFVLAKALVQMKAFLGTPADQAPIVQSLARRAKEKGLAEGFATKAASLYTGKIIPALSRQADYLADLQGKAVHDAGVARLPKGGEYYRVSLKRYTTSTMAPEDIHRTGLELVQSLTADIDAILKAQGITDGSVGQRLAGIARDPKYLYDNTDAAKEQLIADLNLKIAAVQAKLPAYFGTLPKAKVEVRRVPKAIEAGAPGGYYQPGSLDGSRPGAYYINLRDTAEVPKWALPTLTFHESIPGHHLQGTLAREQGLPLLRKMIWFSGYGEGWALYAEQLAVEMGMYQTDPLGHVGQLQGALFRAVRLVIDTGLHTQGWSREKAVAYFVDTLGEKESSAITEVERYCVWPGQACSYMLGKLTWLRVRAKATQALGARFDIKSFHDAGLLSGALPLDVLDQVIDRYIAAA